MGFRKNFEKAVAPKIEERYSVTND